MLRGPLRQQALPNAAVEVPNAIAQPRDPPVAQGSRAQHPLGAHNRIAIQERQHIVTSRLPGPADGIGGPGGLDPTIVKDRLVEDRHLGVVANEADSAVRPPHIGQAAPGLRRRLIGGRPVGAVVDHDDFPICPSGRGDAQAALSGRPTDRPDTQAQVATAAAVGDEYAVHSDPLDQRGALNATHSNCRHRRCVWPQARHLNHRNDFGVLVGLICPPQRGQYTSRGTLFSTRIWPAGFSPGPGRS